MTDKKPRGRWNRAEIEERVKTAFWKAAFESDGEEVAMLGFGELRKQLRDPKRPLPDKTLSSALKSMVERGILERADRKGRPAYRLLLDLSDQDINEAVLASDIQRIQVAARTGVHGGIGQRFSVYGIPSDASRPFRRAVRDLCNKSGEKLVEIFDKELRATLNRVERSLRGRLSPDERWELVDFLFMMTVIESFFDAQPKQAAQRAHLERIFGSESLASFETATGDFFVGQAALHPRKVRLLQSMILPVTESTNERQVLAARFLLGFPQMTAQDLEAAKTAFRRLHLPFVAMKKHARRLGAVRALVGMTIILPVPLDPDISPSDARRSVEVGRKIRVSQKQH